MSAPLTKIVLLGAGGNIGSIVLRGLLADSSLKVTAVKRPKSKATFPTSPNLKVVESDLSQESLVSIFKGNDTVISLVGAQGLGEQKAYVDAAVTAGIKRFFPSEFGVNGQSETVKAMTPFFAMKQDLLDYLVEKEKSGLTWTAVICGVILDFCINNGFIGFDINGKRANIWDDGKTIFSATTNDDIGKAVVNILKKPDQTANKFIYVSSMATSQAEILATLEKSQATKYDVKYESSEKRLDAAREALGKGDFMGAVAIVKTTFLGNVPGLKAHFEEEEKERLANDALGIQRADIAAVVDNVLAGGQYNDAHY